jgi:AcrR family transcriptional regulator
VADPSTRRTRAQRRRETEARILDTARQMFADRGYERTTIRAVAGKAGVDAGLVMHYFGTKADLFARAAKPPVPERSAQVTGEVTDDLLRSLSGRLVSEPAASLAVLRSMLTNSDAADRYRQAAEPELSKITAAIPTADAALRASLLSAIVHGVIIERYLLRLTPLADAHPDKIIDLLRPCFQALAAAALRPSDEQTADG